MTTLIQTDPRARLQFFLRPTRTRRAITWASGKVFRTVFDICADGSERLPARGPVVLICNHVSNFDVIPMQLSLPRPFYAMAKHQAFRNPASSWLFRHLGAFPVVRGQQDQWALDYAIHVLAQGEVLLMLPEGTRNRGHGLRPAKTGAARLAIQAQAPIVPMAIAGTDRLFHPWYRRSPVCVAVGKALYAMPGEAPEALTERAMRALAGLLPAELRGVYA